jgi:hypothetical protein
MKLSFKLIQRTLIMLSLLVAPGKTSAGMKKRMERCPLKVFSFFLFFPFFSFIRCLSACLLFALVTYPFFFFLENFMCLDEETAKNLAENPFFKLEHETRDKQAAKRVVPSINQLLVFHLFTS